MNDTKLDEAAKAALLRLALKVGLRGAGGKPRHIVAKLPHHDADKVWGVVLLLPNHMEDLDASWLSHIATVTAAKRGFALANAIADHIGERALDAALCFKLGECKKPGAESRRCWTQVRIMKIAGGSHRITDANGNLVQLYF